MVRALVTRGSISVADPDSRLPVDHLQGEVVELSNADFDRLFDAGAVVRADVEEAVGAGSEGETPSGDTGAGDGDGQAETSVVHEDAQAEFDREVGLLVKLTHDKIDRAGRKAGVKFPKGATKREKAEAIVTKKFEEG